MLGPNNTYIVMHRNHLYLLLWPENVNLKMWGKDDCNITIVPDAHDYGREWFLDSMVCILNNHSMLEKN